MSEGVGNDDGGEVKSDKVDCEKGQRSNGGQEKFVAPFQVENVVSKTQKTHATNGNNCC